MATRICSLCGTEYDAGRAVCARCGQPPLEPAGDPGSAEGRGRTAKVAAGVILATIALVAFIAMPRSRQATSPAPGMAGAAVRDTLPVQPVQEEVPLVPPSDPAAVPVEDRAFLGELAQGQLAYDAGRFEEALDRFLEALSANPRNAQAASNAAQVLVRLGRPDEALPLLEQAVRIAPSRWDYRFNLGRACAQANRWDEAALEYGEAARLNPDSYPGAYNHAQALQRLGRDDEALAEYRRGAAIAPLEPAFRLAIAEMAERSRRWAEARQAYSEYLELAPDGSDAVKVRQHLEAVERELGTPADAAAPAAATPHPTSL